MRNRLLLSLLVTPSTLLIGCAEPATELTNAHRETDGLHMTHTRAQQVTRGLPVVGAELVEHFDAEGRRTSFASTVVADVGHVDVTPAISREAAKHEALRSLSQPARANADDGELVVLATGGSSVLAYRFTVRTTEPHHLWRVTIDAKTGELVERYDDLQTIVATGRGVRGDVRTFEVSAAPGGSGGHVMIDGTGDIELRTHTAGMGAVLPGQLVSSTALDSWDLTPAGAGAAVDAHANTRIVIDHLFDVHGRKGIDPMGDPVVSTVHYARDFGNAFWDPDLKQMAYGDGGVLYRPLSAALDVVAHEIMHGVTSATSQLRYLNQSGALNEAVSDIFGCFVEHRARPDDVKNWTVGEDVARSAGAGLRSLRDPATSSQPSHMLRYVITQSDAGGVHQNSGIPNHAAYLMTMGGTNAISGITVPFGLGWEKSERLWYRASTSYFLSVTDFASAAELMGQAASDLGYSENERRIVDCAWKAVGVVSGACAAINDPRELPSAPPRSPSPSRDGLPQRGFTAGDLPESTESTEAADAAARTKPRATLGGDTEACAVVHVGGPVDRGAPRALAGLIVAALLARRRRKP